MADGIGAIHKLHPEDRQQLFDELRALFEATARGPALPPPGRPPVTLDYIDAKSFDRLKKDLLHDLGDVVREATAEENEKLRSEMFDIFDDLGMSLEKGEKRKLTRERLSGLFAMQESSKEFKQEFWKMARTSLIAWLLGLCSAAGAYLGLRGGPPH